MDEWKDRQFDSGVGPKSELKYFPLSALQELAGIFWGRDTRRDNHVLDTAGERAAMSESRGSYRGGRGGGGAVGRGAHPFKPTPPASSILASGSGYNISPVNRVHVPL
ncbi:hypothetical protein J6590_066192 [Homalodisca vitripennis]|nr:hypothetical protein J6590_066192 [Homalodisca vitripennis]